MLQFHWNDVHLDAIDTIAADLMQTQFPLYTHFLHLKRTKADFANIRHTYFLLNRIIRLLLDAILDIRHPNDILLLV